MENFSDDEEEEEIVNDPEEAPAELRELLHRKLELERTHRRQELHKQRVKVSDMRLIDANSITFLFAICQFHRSGTSLLLAIL